MAFRTRLEEHKSLRKKISYEEKPMPTRNSNEQMNTSQASSVRGWRFITRSLFGGLVLLAFMSATVSAQITFGSAAEFSGAGFAPRVAVDGENAVEVHQLKNVLGALEYRTGKVSTTGAVVWKAVHRYDTGLAPTVALSGTNVVEIHEGTGGELWYHTGQLLATGTIKWAAPIEYEIGYAPSVAACGSQVIEVHQASQSNPSQLLFTPGHFNLDGTITLSTGGEYDGGFAPAVALAGATVVEVHQGSGLDLWYHVGTVQAGNKVEFSPTGANFDTGIAPTIAIAGSTIVEAHEAIGNSVYSTGFLQANGTIKWNTATEYQVAFLPSIAITGPDIVEVHQGDAGTIWSMTGQY
jgi:hypothetical protein